jgi:hypothetical protein
LGDWQLWAIFRKFQKVLKFYYHPWLKLFHQKLGNILGEFFTIPSGHPARLDSLAGLPDFSWYNVPKRGKYTKLPQNRPNGNKIYQHLPLQNSAAKFTQIAIFWFENIPSGNPASLAVGFREIF